MALTLFIDNPLPNPYTRKMYRNPVVFEGRLDSKDIEKFIINSFNPTNFKITTQSTISTIDTDLDVIEKPTIVVVSNGISLKNIVYKALAHNFTALINVHVYKASKSISSKKLNIDNPSEVMIFLVDSKNTAIQTFTGDLTNINELSNWIGKFVKVDSSHESSEGDEEVEDEQMRSTSTPYEAATLTDTSIPFDEEWIVLVKKQENSDHLKKWIKIEFATGGVVKSVVLTCSTASPHPSTLGQSLCAQGDDNYIVQVPHGSAARKKFLNGDFQKWTTFSASNTTATLKVIGNTLPQSAVDVIPESFLQEVMKRAITQNKLPGFYLPKKSDESLIPPAILHVALSMSKYIELVVVSNPSKKMLAGFGGVLPSVLCFLPHPDEKGEDMSMQPVMFDTQTHGLSYSKLALFFRRNYLNSHFGNSAAADDLFKEEMKGENSQKVNIIEVTNNATWHQACPATFRGLCVIHFYSNEAGYTDKYLKAVSSERTREGSLVSSSKLMYVNGECKVTFSEQFGISMSSLPTIVIYSPHKGRYAIFRGSLSETSVPEFVSSILTGKSPTLPTSQRPSIDDGCFLNDSFAVDPVIEEDASDFLAEILAEEKAQAEALKKATEEELKILSKTKEAGKVKADKKKKKKKTKKTKVSDEDEEL